MTIFKDFIIEGLTQEQRDRFSHIEMTKKARSATDHFFGVGNDKVVGEIATSHNTQKGEIHQKVESHIGREIAHEEYVKGETSDKYGRKARIGKLIKDDKLRNEFASDKNRDGARSYGEKYTTSTHRGVEVAGQSNHEVGHSWASISCKNIEDGTNKHYLPDEIKHGTVIHFVHETNPDGSQGREIYRASLQPHYNEKGHVVYAMGADYGIKRPDFVKSAHDAASALSSHKTTEGIFKRHSKVYPDNIANKVLHPKASDEDVHKALTHEDSIVSVGVARQPSIKPHHIDAALKDKKTGDIVREKLLSHPNASSDNITTGLITAKNDHETMLALEHPNATAYHLSTYHDHPNREVRHVVAGHPQTPSHIIDKMIEGQGDDHDYDLMKHAALNPATSDHGLGLIAKHGAGYVHTYLASNDKLKPHHISTMLDRPRVDYETADSLVKHRNLSSDNIDKMINHPDFGYKHDALLHPAATDGNIKNALRKSPDKFAGLAIKHPKSSDETVNMAIMKGSAYDAIGALHLPNKKASHVDAMLGNSSRYVREAAIKDHPLVNSDHIHEALQDDHRDVRLAAAIHPKVDASHIDAMVKSGDHDLMMAAMGHRLASHEHLMTGVKHSDRDIAAAAVQNDNATHEHVEKALEHHDRVVNVLGAMHKKATDEQVHRAAHSHSNPDVRKAAGIALRARTPSASL